MRSRKDNLKALFLAACVLLGSVRAQAAEEGASPNGSGFTMHVGKITTLQREAEELENDIKKLIEEKREADSEASVRTMTSEIAEKFKALKEAGEKLEAEQNLVRFKYPEQAEKLDRKYVRFKSKSLKEIEGEVGIDGKLDRIHEHVLATFPVPEIEAAKHAPPKISPIFLRKPASIDDQDVPEKITLSK